MNGMYSYEISVTSADPEAFVITQDGTRGRRSFFSSLGIEGLSSMPLVPGTYAGRSEDGLVVILSRVCEGSSVFFIVEFPSELFSVPDDSGIVSWADHALRPNEAPEVLYELPLADVANPCHRHSLPCIIDLRLSHAGCGETLSIRSFGYSKFLIPCLYT